MNRRIIMLKILSTCLESEVQIVVNDYHFIVRFIKIEREKLILMIFGGK